MRVGEFFKDVVINKLTFQLARKKWSPVCSQIQLDDQDPHIVVDNRLFNILDRTDKKMVDCSQYPMLVPPIPWLDKESGAFLLKRQTFIRQHLPKNFRIRYDNDNMRIMKILDSCNILGSIPWMINSDILSVITNCYNQGQSDKLDIPHHGCSTMKTSSLFQSFASKMNYEQYYWSKKRNDQDYSMKCDFLNKLLIAQSLVGKVFWQPHNVDFRSRVYTLSPYLTHYGNDMGRSIMKFANKKPLGPIGLMWMKIDLVNKIEAIKFNPAVDKLQFFETELAHKVHETAENPYAVII